MKRSKRATRQQLKQMVKNWELYPEIAAANISQNVWIKLTASFKVSQRQAKAMTKVMAETMESLKNHFYVQTAIGSVHVNMKAEAGPEVFEALNQMVKLAYQKTK